MCIPDVTLKAHQCIDYIVMRSAHHILALMLISTKILQHSGPSFRCSYAYRWRGDHAAKIRSLCKGAATVLSVLLALQECKALHRVSSSVKFPFDCSHSTRLSISNRSANNMHAELPKPTGGASVIADAGVHKEALVRRSSSSACWHRLVVALWACAHCADSLAGEPNPSRGALGRPRTSSGASSQCR
jgi:hypothetical protein